MKLSTATATPQLLTFLTQFLCANDCSVVALVASNIYLSFSPRSAEYKVSGLALNPIWTLRGVRLLYVEGCPPRLNIVDKEACGVVG